VLIDHKTPSGFEGIIEAREYLLKLGNRASTGDSSEDYGSSEVVGAHVVAPVGYS